MVNWNEYKLGFLDFKNGLKKVNGLMGLTICWAFSMRRKK